MQEAAEADASWEEAVVVRLLRRWIAAGECTEAPLRSLLELGESLGVSAEAAVALDSFFQLIEGTLERPLRTECCCSTELSSDERAILLALAAASSLDAPRTSVLIPHGLGGPLGWAASRVRRLLGNDCWTPDPFPARQCPFARI